MKLMRCSRKTSSLKSRQCFSSCLATRRLVSSQQHSHQRSFNFQRSSWTSPQGFWSRRMNLHCKASANTTLHVNKLNGSRKSSSTCTATSTSTKLSSTATRNLVFLIWRNLWLRTISSSQWCTETWNKLSGMSSWHNSGRELLESWSRPTCWQEESTSNKLDSSSTMRFPAGKRATSTGLVGLADSVRRVPPSTSLFPGTQTISKRFRTTMRLRSPRCQPT